MLVARYLTVSSASAPTSHRTQFASVIKTFSTASVCRLRRTVCLRYKDQSRRLKKDVNYIFSPMLEEMGICRLCKSPKYKTFNCLARLPYNSQSYALYSYAHEPTKKVTKVGALLFGQATSLRPFRHSCLRDSSLDCHSRKINT